MALLPKWSNSKLIFPKFSVLHTYVQLMPINIIQMYNQLVSSIFIITYRWIDVYSFDFSCLYSLLVGSF